MVFSKVFEKLFKRIKKYGRNIKKPINHSIQWKNSSFFLTIIRLIDDHVKVIAQSHIVYLIQKKDKEN